MNGNGFDNNPFDNNNDDYLFQMVTGRGRRKTYGWSLAAMICGIISVLCCFGYTGLIFGVLAIVFSVISRKNLGYFDGMSIAGLVLGIIGLVLGIAIIIAVNTVDEELLKEYLEEYLKEYNAENPETVPDT